MEDDRWRMMFLSAEERIERKEVERMRLRC